MAKGKPRSTAPKIDESSESETVIRISAKSSKVASKAKSDDKPRPDKKPASTKERKSIIGYVKGAYAELKQVHWPNRRATWSLTGAVLLFIAIFMTLIILLDIGFDLLFKQIL